MIAYLNEKMEAIVEDREAVQKEARAFLDRQEQMQEAYEALANKQQNRMKKLKEETLRSLRERYKNN